MYCNGKGGGNFLHFVRPALDCRGCQITKIEVLSLLAHTPHESDRFLMGALDGALGGETLLTDQNYRKVMDCFPRSFSWGL